MVRASLSLRKLQKHLVFISLASVDGRLVLAVGQKLHGGPSRRNNSTQFKKQITEIV
jgi:hypothetical protein